MTNIELDVMNYYFLMYMVFFCCTAVASGCLMGIIILYRLGTRSLRERPRRVK